MEGMIDSVIKQLLLRDNLLTETQFTQIQSLNSRPFAAVVQTGTEEVNSSGEVRRTALDIKAAFDCEWHREAQAISESMGMEGKPCTGFSHAQHKGRWLC